MKKYRILLSISDMDEAFAAMQKELSDYADVEVAGLSGYSLRGVDLFIGKKMAADALGEADRLKAVFAYKTGVDDFPVRELGARGILLFNSHVKSRYIAQYSVGLAMALVSRIAEFDRKLRLGDWDNENPFWKSLFNMRVGLVGYGHIGREIHRLLLANETDPVLWRGPVIAGAIRQFWSDTSWGPLDYLLVDMPPGTGDVALTVFQSLPVDGIVVVTSPQDLVSMIVAKAVNMADKMNVPILGIIENMSYITCPDCGKKIEVFGPSKLDEVAEGYGVKVLGRLPIDPALALACDAGAIEEALPSDLLPDAIAACEAVEPHEGEGASENA